MCDRVLIVGLAVVVLAGCGGNGNGYRAPATATAVRTPAATATSPAPMQTPAATSTATTAVTNTGAPTPTATRAATGTATAAATATSTAVASPTEVSTATATSTGTPIDTATPTGTPTASPTATSAVPNPTIEGPVTGGRGSPFVQSTNFALADVGYEQAEFFLSGTARAYTNLGEFGMDGVWPAGLAAGTAAYKTRIVVYRPIDPQQFNGTVVVEWLNVSGGLDAGPDWTFTHTELIREGYVWVGVSAQRVGIEGGGGPFNLSLKNIDAARYGSLHHPGDTFSYDMFSQVGRALRDRRGAVDPLSGLQPERLIAIGESQSAFRLVTYVNAVHPLVHIYDGFMIHSRGGGGAALSQAPEPDVPVPTVAFIRTDLDIPVLTFETETDLLVLGFLPARQPDGPLFRLWEVAGTAHADTYSLVLGFVDKGGDPAVAEVMTIAKPIPGFIECDSPVNSGYQHFVLKAAIAALDRWVRGGEPPPIAPRLDVAEGEPPQYRVDEFGNALGGIRTPVVDVPTAKLSGLGQTGGNFCRIFGTTVLFDAVRLAELYPMHDGYVMAVNDATDAAVAAGFVLPADAPLIKQAAAESDIGS